MSADRPRRQPRRPSTWSEPAIEDHEDLESCSDSGSDVEGFNGFAHHAMEVGQMLYEQRSLLVGKARAAKHMYKQLSQKNLWRKRNFFAVVALVAIGISSVCLFLGVVLFDNHERALPSGDDYILDDDTTNVSPTNAFDDRTFVRYYTIVVWFTTVITGLGAELMMGSSILVLVTPGSGKVAWRYSQLVFSMFACVSIFAQSSFGIPFLVIGLWKGGFPETLGHFVFSHMIGKPTIASVGHFINGMAVLLHHSAAAFVCINTYTGLYPLSRPLLAIVMPLIVQHWFALLRYEYPNLYNVLLISWEIIFEWEVFANVGLLSTDHGFDFTARGMALIMLFSHWMFIFSGGLEAIEPMFRPESDPDWEHDVNNPDADELYCRDSASSFGPPAAPSDRQLAVQDIADVEVELGAIAEAKDGVDKKD